MQRPPTSDTCPAILRGCSPCGSFTHAQDGLVEINTYFLIARRAVPRFYRAFNSLYWATFYPIRVVLFPALLPWFYLEMKPYAWWVLGPRNLGARWVSGRRGAGTGSLPSSPSHALTAAAPPLLLSLCGAIVGTSVQWWWEPSSS